MKIQAINKIYDIYAKGSSQKRNPKKNIMLEELEKIMADVISARVVQMRTIARKQCDELLAEIKKNKESYGFLPENLFEITKSGLKGVDSTHRLAYKLNQRIVRAYNRWRSETKPEELLTRLTHNYQILAYMYALIAIKPDDKFTDASSLSKEIIELTQIKISMLQKILKYTEHLRDTRATEKLILVTEIIGRLVNSDGRDYAKIVNDLEPICNPRSLDPRVPEGMKLFLFLEKKLKRFEKLNILFKKSIAECENNYHHGTLLRKIKLLDWLGVKPIKISDKSILFFSKNIKETDEFKSKSKKLLLPDSIDSTLPKTKAGNFKDL